MIPRRYMYAAGILMLLVIVHGMNAQGKGTPSPPIRSLGDTATYRFLDTATSYVSTSYIDREYYLKANDVIYYYFLAQTAFSQKNFRKALNMAEQSVALEPTPEALGLLGSAHFFLGNRSSAALHWRRAVALDPAVTVPEYMKPLLPGLPEQTVDGPE